MANIVSKGRLEYANDSITAGLVDGDTDTRAAVLGAVSPLVAEALTDPSTSGIVTGAVNTAVPPAVAAELTANRIVKAGTTTASTADNSTSVITSQSGYLLVGWDQKGDLSSETQAMWGAQIAHRYTGPKLAGIRDIWLTPSGYADIIFYDNGAVEIPGLIGGGSGGTSDVVYTEVKGSDFYLVNRTTGVRLRLGTATDVADIVRVGSSSFAGMTTQFNALATAHTATNVNRSYAGTGAEVAFAALGSRPLLLSEAVTIAASGTTQIKTTNVTMGINNTYSFAGSWNGDPALAGTVAKTGTGSATTLTFTRTTPGSAVALPIGAVFVAATPANAILIINPGKNNTTALSGVTSDINQVKQWCTDAFNWATSAGKTVLFVDHYIDTGTAAPGTGDAGADAVRVRTADLNAHLATFGKRCVKLSAYITGSQVWTDTGISPTSEDLAQQALGNKPPSLSALNGDLTVDPLHMNDAAKTAVMDHLIRPQLETVLNWF